VLLTLYLLSVCCVVCLVGLEYYNWSFDQPLEKVKDEAKTIHHHPYSKEERSP